MERVPRQESRSADDHGREAPGHFAEASREALRFLRRRLGFDLWMVTRTDEDDWTVLTAEDHGYGIEGGDVLRWSDSFCSRMVRGEGPRLAPRSDDVPAYREAPVAQVLPIRAYAGAPIRSGDGTLFGTLCAIDPAEQAAELAHEADLVDLVAGLLGRVLAAEQERDDAVRRADLARASASLDPLTEFVTRRGWHEALDRQEVRGARYGDRAGVVCVDVLGFGGIVERHGRAAGDEVLLDAAEALRSVVSGGDLVAYLGGGDFAVLAVGVGADQLRRLEERVAAAMADVGVHARAASALREHGGGLRGAWAAALAVLQSTGVAEA